MYILKQGNLVAYAAKTEDEINKIKEYMSFDEIIETEDTYILKNGIYLTESEAVLHEKLEKHSENARKAKETVENGYVVFKNAEFETNAQTVGDLTATMLMLQAQQNNRHSEPESIFEGEESICHSENTVILSETKALNIDSSPAVQNDNITYTWLSKDDQSVELTLDDFITLGNLISEFKNTVWNVKYTAFKTAIEQAQTLEELENIEINYANTDI